MTGAVVEIGPRSVRGPGTAPAEWISVAIECVDDPLALLDDRLVEVPALWHDVLGAALDTVGDVANTLVLVFPTWWPSARVEMLGNVAGALADSVVVVRRSEILADGTTTVVEISEDIVVVSHPNGGRRVLDRADGWDTAELAAEPAVLLDVPAGVPVPADLLTRLRADGVRVECSDAHRVRRAAAAHTGRREPRRAPARAWVALLAVAALGAGWLAQSRLATPADALLVEGHAAVRVPARWAVERITAGPGSARVRVAAPGGLPALHITQSVGAPASIEQVGDELRQALHGEPDGVFADFDTAGRPGGRPAVTYRERRAGSETAWAVVVDGAVRIAIGCQSDPAHGDELHDVCVRAIRSAHAIR
ncbi:type VII secretion-associated protein [Mycobacterium sp. Y57]|uniref:type VII secretion-associated protein n=1 Tax=Mycolicibacterium xanthum TaxID=2796469 RepID=UPI001C85CE88|nr:type VII secretion-associated protein [Mycolicibacterium xanthum]MBX7432180.1 type VII secretion-associated protein [Mycolicibacterium xanthum]